MLFLQLAAFVHMPAAHSSTAVRPLAPLTFVLKTHCAAGGCLYTLPGGVEYPTQAINTASLSPDTIDGLLREGVKLGITSVDFHLGTEREGVALAVKALGRSKFFLITKINPPPANLTNASAAADLVRQSVATELSYSALGTDFVDVLLLKDSPSCAVMQAQWKVVEEMLDTGRARAIGTYN
jgi:diketogulonate reductase-like aldo/keto reductase